MAVSSFALCTLGQVRQFLQLTAASAVRDGLIEREIERVAQEVESYTRRLFVGRDHLEYLDGSGDSEQRLTHRPLISLGSLNDDINRVWAGTDTIDKANVQLLKGQGRLRLWDKEGGFGLGFQNVRVEYFAGYAIVDINWGANKIDFKEHAAGTQYTAIIPPGEHDVVSLASHVMREMNATAGLNTYHATFDTKSRKYTVTMATGGTGTLQLLWNSGANTTESLGLALGFSTSADLTGATSYTPATNVLPRIPRDIEQAAIEIVSERYDRSPYGQDRLGIRSESIGDYSVTFFGTPIPEHVSLTLERYKKHQIS